jgi:hypothetical protein
LSPFRFVAFLGRNEDSPSISLCFFSEDIRKNFKIPSFSEGKLYFLREDFNLPHNPFDLD